MNQKSRTRPDQSIDRRLREKVREAKARGRTYETHAAPPVMVRGGLAGSPLPLRKSSKSKAKRRVDVTLNVPGAEMRLPSLPQISLDLRMLSALLTASLAFLLYYFWNSSTFRVDAAEIVGLQRLNSRDVNTVLNVSGEAVFALDPQMIIQQAKEAFPEFSTISVEIALPRSVVVTVEERVPILTWRQDGRTVLVDAKGVSFPMRDMAGAAPALVVDAFSAPPMQQLSETADPAQMQFMPVEMVSAILSMSAQAPKGTPLIYDAKHGLGWKDKTWEVYFGDMRDMDMKLRIYRAMVKQFERDGVQPELISVEFPHAPYYRLER
jgi:cell division septal protein FtsQ